MPSVLFVCTANRFRSPLAAFYFEREVVRRGDEAHIRVASAGTWTTPGLPAMHKAIRLARDKDLDLTSHQSRLITEEILDRADLILVMEAGHKEGIVHDFPSAAVRIYLLTEAVGLPPVDILDPYLDNAPADEVAKEIFGLIDQGYDQIVELAWRMVAYYNQ